MGFSSIFKNLGHALAKTAKAVATGIKDVVVFANKAKDVEPGLELLIGALAGPQAAKYTDLAFHAFGDVAAAIEKIGPDLEAVVGSAGLNIQMDIQTVLDIKAAIPVLKSIITSVGVDVPKQ